MKIERTKDKLVITETELQQLIKDHIRETTGRTVFGSVNFQLMHTSGSKSDSATAFCWLDDESEPRLLRVPITMEPMPLAPAAPKPNYYEDH